MASETEYYRAQADVLAWLDGDVGEDDDAMAPICSRLTAEFALWCLGLNLAIAGGLKTAEREGKTAANKWNKGADAAYYTAAYKRWDRPPAPTITKAEQERMEKEQQKWIDRMTRDWWK